VTSRVAAAVKAKFTTVQTPVASTLGGQGGGTAKIPLRASLRRSRPLHADPLERSDLRRGTERLFFSRDEATTRRVTQLAAVSLTTRDPGSYSRHTVPTFRRGCLEAA